MFQIVLFLLKIIGIVLASILGILLFLIIVVLVVPIRYRIKAEHRVSIKGEAKISWLFHIVHFHALYANDKLNIRLRIFGKIFYDINRPRNEKANKKKTKSRKKTNTPDKKEKKRVNLPKEMESRQKNVGKKAEQTPDMEGNKTINEDKETINKAFAIPDKSTQTKRTGDLDLSKEDSLDKEYYSKIEDSSQKGYKKKDTKKRKKRKSILSVMKGFLQNIKNLFTKIKLIFIKIGNIFGNINNNLQNVKNKLHKIYLFTQDEINKIGIKKSLLSLRRILKHLHPKKLKIEIEFGTGDPCSTGQVLGIMAFFYGYYNKSVSIIPNFEKVILEGTLYCTGRIRLITLLIICIKLIINDEFKKLIKNFKVFKEDL